MDCHQIFRICLLQEDLQLIRFWGVSSATVVMATVLKFPGVKVCSKIFNAFCNLKYCSWLHHMCTKCKWIGKLALFWKQNGHHITSLMPNRRVIISKRPYISLIIVSTKGIRWILWSSLRYATAAVCREIFALTL